MSETSQLLQRVFMCIALKGVNIYEVYHSNTTIWKFGVNNFFFFSEVKNAKAAFTWLNVA